MVTIQGDSDDTFAGKSMRLQIELPTFAHAVLYHPAVAAPGAAAVSDALAEPQIQEPWIALQVHTLRCLISSAHCNSTSCLYFSYLSPLWNGLLSLQHPSAFLPPGLRQDAMAMRTAIPAVRQGGGCAGIQAVSLLACCAIAKHPPCSGIASDCCQMLAQVRRIEKAGLPTGSRGW